MILSTAQLQRKQAILLPIGRAYDGNIQNSGITTDDLFNTGHITFTAGRVCAPAWLVQSTRTVIIYYRPTRSSQLRMA